MLSICPLVKYLKGESAGIIITNFNDEILTTQRDVKYNFDDFKTYREKIISYLQKHFGELKSVKKIINLEELNTSDLNELQAVLSNLKTPDDSEEFSSTQELIIFIRKIIGLDKKTIDEKCAAFLNENNFNREQRQFINLIIDFAIRNGNVTNNDLVNEEPFCNYEILEIFEHDIDPLLQIISLFNDPLNVVA